MTAPRWTGVGRWLPAMLLTGGLALSWSARTQEEPELRMRLQEAVPSALQARQGVELPISPEEQRVAGMTSYLYRRYGATATSAFTLYVGYYASQAYGRTIHSPRNCLPGAGWQALASRTVSLGPGQPTVNYYLLQKGEERALALYWYQGRGRIEWNEYQVKLDLVRDAALRGRTEEALVRVVVPIAREETARATALAVAKEVIPAIARALPA